MLVFFWKRQLAVLLFFGILLLVRHSSSMTILDDDYPNCTDHPSAQDSWKVVVTDLDAVGHGGASLISRVNGTSDFRFNFNAPWFPAADGNPEEGLIVRVVDGKKHPQWANAGAMAVVPVTFHRNKSLSAGKVAERRVTWAGAAPPDAAEVWGAADPRIAYHNPLYYLTWDNCTENCWPQRVTYLSTTLNPFDATAWTFHGAVFPFPYTSGAALLFRDEKNAPHLAFVCNSNTADTIFIAESHNGLQWKVPDDPARRVLMKGRPGCWDAKGVAAGPQPELLSSTGDYLLIYNIDTGWPYHPNPLGRCAIGWAILDGNDPTQVVARARRPLLVATRPWETCQNTSKENCQVKEVVFASGLKPLGDDEFLIVYGAADSVVAVSKIKVIRHKEEGYKIEK